MHFGTSFQNEFFSAMHSLFFPLIQGWCNSDNHDSNDTMVIRSKGNILIFLCYYGVELVTIEV